jgi:hypothetical protein
LARHSATEKPNCRNMDLMNFTPALQVFAPYGRGPPLSTQVEG